jgi:two-component system, OmpR family, sensor histidine kinase MprB
MTLAGRLALGFAALAVTVSTVMGGLAYAATARGLDDQAREVLLGAAETMAGGQVPEGLWASTAPVAAGGHGPGSGSGPGATTPGAGPGDDRYGTPLLAQDLAPSGTATGVAGLPARLPATAGDVTLARDPADHEVVVFREVDVDGRPYLMVTRSLGRGRGAVQVARDTAWTRAVLTELAGTLVVVAVVVAAAAAVAALFLARALTRRLVRLTAAAEQVGATGRLDVPVTGHGRDEVGRLGAAFEAMLVRLAQSKDDQQRLVQNAGHELRTPLTSIRTNVSLLGRGGELSAEERRAILDDLTGETRELTDLVNELVELATDRRAEEPEAVVDVREVARSVATRAERRSGRQVTVTVPGVGPGVVGPGAAGRGAGPLVLGRVSGLERALWNLVDNAIKFDVHGREPVEIVVAATLDGVRVEVRDRGPGVPDEDLGRIFDRFHRATSVRSLPGSGLGLAIVQEVAQDHGGGVFVTPRDGGGTMIGFTLAPGRLQTSSNPG